MSDDRIKAIRRFATWTFVKVVAALGAAFLLGRVFAPELLNARDDALGWLGILCALAVPVILGWAGVAIFLSARRFLAEIGAKP